MQTDYGFTGQRAAGFGLVDYGARFYSPPLGRFAQADSIIPDTFNPLDFDRYSYTQNNPVKYIDPDGHVAIPPPYSLCPDGCPIIDMSDWSSGARFIVTAVLAFTVDNITLGRTGVYGDSTWGLLPDAEYTNSGAWLVPPVFGGVVGGADDLAKAGKGFLSNVDARKWYLKQEARIRDLINPKLTLEDQAKQAFELRNQFRTQARNLMADRDLAERLMREEPNLTWDQVIRRAKDKGYSGDDIYRYIIDSSQRSRPSVNIDLGLER